MGTYHLKVTDLHDGSHAVMKISIRAWGYRIGEVTCGGIVLQPPEEFRARKEFRQHTHDLIHYLANKLAYKITPTEEINHER